MILPFHALRLHFIDASLDDEVLFGRLQTLAEGLRINVRPMSPEEQHEADTYSVIKYTAGWWQKSTRTIALHKKHRRDPFTLAHEIGHAKCSDVVGQYHREDDADNMGRAVLLSVLSPIEREAVLWRLRFQMPERPPSPDEKVLRRAEKYLALAARSDSENERSVALARYAEIAPAIEAASPEMRLQKERSLKSDLSLYRTRRRFEWQMALVFLAVSMATIVRVIVNQEADFNPLTLISTPLFFYVPHHVFNHLGLNDRCRPYVEKAETKIERVWRTVRTTWYKWSHS